MKTKLEKTSIIHNNITERTYTQYHDGGCMCYKDCNCYTLKGNVIGEFKVYSHPNLTHKKCNRKNYFSLKAIEQALKSKNL